MSALWSEHCSYKHSKPLLKTLPTTAPYVLQGPGENAGVIAVGDGMAVAFKIESHNHPSAVEPYQGAATGVGGILRDVFTMGARPIAMLNSLRFGSLATPRVRYLFAGVVRGIGDYGNCVGCANSGRRSRLRPSVRGQPAGQRHVRRHPARGRADSRGGAGRRQPDHRGRRAHGPRRDSRGVVRIRRSLDGERCQAASRTSRRSVHGEAASRGQSGADPERPYRRHPGHGSRRPDVVVGGDGRAGRCRRDDRRLQGAGARARYDPVRDPAERITGADAGRRAPRS